MMKLLLALCASVAVAFAPIRQTAVSVTCQAKVRRRSDGANEGPGARGGPRVACGGSALAPPAAPSPLGAPRSPRGPPPAAPPRAASPRPPGFFVGR